MANATARRGQLRAWGLLRALATASEKSAMGHAGWAAPAGVVTGRPPAAAPWAADACSCCRQATILHASASYSAAALLQARPLSTTQQQQQQQAQQAERRLPAPSAAGSHAPRAQGRLAHALAHVGWSREEVLNLPNSLSMARLLSGPLIASWILDGQWSLALPALALAGASDWLDGHVAKHYSRPSVVGSYLDPLADKVLVGSVVAALGWSGTMSPAIVGIILGRDVLLVSGAFAARAKALGWRWPGLGEFFRVSPAPAAAPPASDGRHPQQQQQQQRQRQQQRQQRQQQQGSGGGEVHAAPLVQPLYISKVNTAFQLGLVAACISRAWLGWPGEDAVWWGSAATAGTTVWSCAAYVHAYAQGRVLAAPAAASK